MGKNATSFKKGNPGGPGRPRIPDELKRIKPMSNDAVKRKFTAYLELPFDELQKLADNDKIPALDKWTARLILLGAKDGDDKRLGFLLDRLIGKVTDKVEIETPKPFIYERLDGSKVVAGVSYEKNVTPKELGDGKDNSGDRE